jgi:hypothetical protein
MAKLPEHAATNPMTLACPRCHAAAGRVCDKLPGEFEMVHMERIAAAAAKTVEIRRLIHE